MPPRFRACIAIPVCALLACAPEEAHLGPPNGTATAKISGVSFAGDVTFERVQKFPSTLPLDGSLEHAYSTSSHLNVRFFIPSAVYAGVGTYTCGADPLVLPEQYGYCTLTVEHAVSATTSATWTTEGAPSGVYGPLTGCNVMVDQDGSTAKSGRIACAGLPFATAFGAHPDAGVDLTITSTWTYPVSGY